MLSACSIIGWFSLSFLFTTAVEIRPNGTAAIGPARRSGREHNERRNEIYAALASSCRTPPAGALPMEIFRGFIASGISRTNSIFSKPFSNAALFTWT